MQIVLQLSRTTCQVFILFFKHNESAKGRKGAEERLEDRNAS